ncbi:MAG: stalk domain-containing protein [Desulfitobacteriaceae bacterium]|nr:stalk domain-containing protein [Desulfitobacteriaceae bacterium]
MKKIGIILFTVIFCLIINPVWAAEEMPGRIVLTVGQTEVLLDETSVTIDTSPVIINGRTFVPLRFIGESFGSTVSWDGVKKEIQITGDNENITLWIGKSTSLVNGENRELDVAPQLAKGRTIVPLRFVAEVFGCVVNFESANKKITIVRPNSPPIAEFSLTKTIASVGEVISYQDLSSDPDGDMIVEREWSGYQDQFDAPGIYTISLRVKDSRGSWSDWFSQTIEIEEAAGPKPMAKFSLDKYQVIVGEKVQYFDESYDPAGGKISDRVWENKSTSFTQPGVYEIKLRVRNKDGVWSDWCIQEIEVLEKPNEPPVAKFSVNRTKVDQGVTVEFTDKSFDPDGDEITEYRWTGKQRAYFSEGIVPVTLQVKDKRGDWSEPYTVELNVTGRVVMSEIEYNLNYPLAGEMVRLSEVNPISFPKLDPVSREDDNTTLILSNSPETVGKSGLLYRDSASGRVRLMYSHKNISGTAKKLYILAYNNSSQTVKITKTQKGWGGPSPDDLAVGQACLKRYLNSSLNSISQISPGDTVILEQAGEGSLIHPNQSVTGMTDLYIEGQISFIFVMVDPTSDVLGTYASLPELEKDRHPRGTFFGANRVYRLNIQDRESTRFVFGDNLIDRFIYGTDALTGDTVINKGNYGVVYTVEISAGTRLGVLTNPRGGVFMGAGLLPDGTVYGLPGAGLIKDSAYGVMNMVIEKGREERFIFSPPASSNMPVALLFIPF